MSAVFYSRLLHCQLIHPVCPSTSPPPNPNTKFCISTVFIFSWGWGADYCNVPAVIAGRNWKQCLLWGRSGGRGHKKFITEQCESGEFLRGLWWKLLASFHSSRYLLIDFHSLFHHGYDCRENATRGVPLQLSLLEGISPSLSKLLFIFPVSCPVVRNWLLWGVKPFVDTFSPCPCLGVATSCSTSLQSLSSSGSFLLS